MRLLLIALLFAISYAQTGRVAEQNRQLREENARLLEQIDRAVGQESSVGVVNLPSWIPQWLKDMLADLFGAEDLPVCKCQGYPSHYNDGDEMCEFASRTCMKASVFKNGCSSNMVHCVLDSSAEEEEKPESIDEPEKPEEEEKPEIVEEPEKPKEEENPEIVDEPEASEESEETSNCCSKDWENGESFCKMADFVEESVPACGKCLYDKQCEGFWAAYETRPAGYATGDVYCCPDAKRCVDRRATDENPRGVGCPSNQDVAGCGRGRDGLCGQRLQDDDDYPQKCVGCTNEDFPQSWMEEMSCPVTESAKFFAFSVTTRATLEATMKGSALLGLLVLIYGTYLGINKCFSSSKYTTIPAQTSHSDKI